MFFIFISLRFWRYAFAFGLRPHCFGFGILSVIFENDKDYKDIKVVFYRKFSLWIRNFGSVFLPRSIARGQVVLSGSERSQSLKTQLAMCQCANAHKIPQAELGVSPIDF